MLTGIYLPSLVINNKDFLYSILLHSAAEIKGRKPVQILFFCVQLDTCFSNLMVMLWLFIIFLGMYLCCIL